MARSARDEVDGLIVVSGGDMTDERIARLERTGLPTVLVDNFIIGHNVHAVVADNYGAASWRRRTCSISATGGSR